MDDPLRRPPRRGLRRLLLVAGVFVLVGGLLGGGYYVHRLQKAAQEDALRRVEENNNVTRGKGLSKDKLRYTEAKATYNGTVEKPVREVKVPEPPPPRPAQPTQKPAPQPIKRAQMIYLVNEHKDTSTAKTALYTLASWTYIPCILEAELNSEIEGKFTVKTKRVVMDHTGTHVLIPAGRRVGAKDTTSQLLLGNERIPTWALSVDMPDGTALDLGDAPIMDAAGTNGLTGEVDNHVWRLIWTTVAIGTLNGGRQVLQTELGQTTAGPVASGIVGQGSNVMQQRLGRAQDTRPTIRAKAGDSCNILVTKPMQLPSATTVATR